MSDIIKTGVPLCDAIKAQTGVDIMGTLGLKRTQAGVAEAASFGTTFSRDYSSDDADSNAALTFAVGQDVICKANAAKVIKVNFDADGEKVMGYDIQFEDGACESVGKELVRATY